MESTTNYVSTPELDNSETTVYFTEDAPKNLVTVLPEGTTLTISGPAKRGRGRPAGAKGVCSVCGQTGHNKRTCKAAVAPVVEAAPE